ncbi:MAG: histidine kinase [Flavobacteriales bacterium]|nr:histidine kinase [Flavobacteriales bacterium]
MKSYLQSSPVPMRTAFLAAGLLSAIFVFTSFIGRTQLGTDLSRFDWWMQAPGPFLNFFTWAILLPLVNRWCKRWPLNTRPFWKAFAPLFSNGLVLSIAHELFTNVLYLCLLHYSGRMPWQPEMLNGALLTLPAGVVQRFLEYWLLLLLLRYVDAHRQIRAEQTRVLQLQNELQTTQLLSLKKQLQPHFLFNTLNTVSALMDEDTKGARTVLSRLGQLLRTSLDEERREKVPLIHEVDHVGNYLDIESIRFRDRLEVSYDIPAECQYALVPGMILQPLVENSIKHGLDVTCGQMHIAISAERQADKLVLHVADNGRGCDTPMPSPAKGGIGLRNARERIALLYGTAGIMEVASREGHGFRVTLRLPFEPMEGSNR